MGEDKKKKCYDIMFNDDEKSDSKGFRESFEYCLDYIRTYNGTNDGYFNDYKGGIVSICDADDYNIVYYNEVVK